MLRRRTLLLLTVALCLALGAGAAAERDRAEDAAVVYSEDFSSDPGYDTMLNDYAFWDGSNGSYFALSLDVGSGIGRYVGYRPEFDVVSGDFTVSFDMAVLAPNYGNYPGVWFQNTNVPDPTRPDGYHLTFYCDFQWSDSVARKFVLWSDNGGYHETSGSPTTGQWYHFEIVYHSASQTADWTIEGFQQLTGVSFPISGGFNRLYIGEITLPPKYGDQSAVKVDNIEIDAPVSVERTSWGFIKASFK